MKFWKLSHGKGSFDDKQFKWLLDNKLLAVHKDTGHGQGRAFSEKLSEGDVVCLSRSNEVFALVQVESSIIDNYANNPLDKEWLLKRYSIIKRLTHERKYYGKQKGWTPNYNSTCREVPNNEIFEFEELILKPFFGLTAEELGATTANEDKSEVLITGETIQLNLNTIFYGPPGTGKTYYTIEAAVNAAERSYKASSRQELKTKYDELVAEKRIRFVTFHQSYGYEEFVEGLRANVVQGQVSYDVEPGVFKQICEQARQGVEPDSDPLEQAIEQFKSELEESSVLNLKTLRGNDFGVQYHGNTTFRVFPEATSHDDLGSGYPVSIDNIRKLYRDISAKKIYNTSYVKSILSHIKQTYKIKDYEFPKQGQAKNFVLIIDEINRGNISKIFGELITLIEDSKRSGEGQNEALEVILPNSGEPFSVPNNLYLIGTMNTADRSLAMMDTALRRRFDFVEMMPNPYLFDGMLVKDISITKLLMTMNNRIEALYDREHTLGHAFFVPVLDAMQSGDEDKVFKALIQVFINKVVPLLEEYFFDDWNNIRLVLGDNQKPQNLQFVSQSEVSYQDLFGDNHGLDSYEQTTSTYSLISHIEDGSVWNDPAAYVAIYEPTVV